MKRWRMVLFALQFTRKSTFLWRQQDIKWSHAEFEAHLERPFRSPQQNDEDIQDDFAWLQAAGEINNDLALVQQQTISSNFLEVCDHMCNHTIMLLEMSWKILHVKDFCFSMQYVVSDCQRQYDLQMMHPRWDKLCSVVANIAGTCILFLEVYISSTACYRSGIAGQT